jgi:cysteine desulfurase
MVGSILDNKDIYLDSPATTRVDPDDLDTMLPYFNRIYGNGNHSAGWKSNAAMERARIQVSSLLGGRPTEVIFTSGATEAINLGLLGLANDNKSNRNHLVTQRTEHPAILNCIKHLQEKGFRVTVLDVDEVGRIDLEELERTVTDETLVVAIMLANNEIGTIQPVEEIGQICYKYGAKFFCDLTQGLGWHPIAVDKMNIDLAAMSSHKIYGPRGVGALYVRRFPKVSLAPVLLGGGQERGIRPGTTNIPGIVGFGKACEILSEDPKRNKAHISFLRDRLKAHIFKSIEGVKLNGCAHLRHPGNLNLTIPNVSGEDLIGALPNIIFSTGSACSAGSTKPSHVLCSLGLGEEALKTSFRFGIGKFNTSAEIDFVGKRIVEVTRALQARRS